MKGTETDHSDHFGEFEHGRDEQRRPVDVTSLTAGLAVLALCAVFAFGDLESLDDQVRVVWPLVLGTIGVALLAGVRRG